MCLILCGACISEARGCVEHICSHACRYGHTCNIGMIIQGNGKYQGFLWCCPAVHSHNPCRNLNTPVLSAVRASHTFLSKLLREEFCYILKSSLLIFPARKALQRHENLRLQAGSFCIENTVALCMDKAIVDSDLKKRLGFFFLYAYFLRIHRNQRIVCR